MGSDPILAELGKIVLDVDAANPYSSCMISALAVAAESPAVGKTKWGIVAGIVVIHAGALLAPFTFTWSAFWVFVVFQFITGLLGVTLCYHRLLAHRSFQVPKWLEYTLTVCGSLALQGGRIKWVSTRRVHHAFSDRPQDPQSPTSGFWWAHMLWLFA